MSEVDYWDRVDEIERKGYSFYQIDDATVKFRFRSEIIKFYPFSGYFEGEGIEDGYGLDNLLKQI